MQRLDFGGTQALGRFTGYPFAIIVIREDNTATILQGRDIGAGQVGSDQGSGFLNIAEPELIFILRGQCCSANVHAAQTVHPEVIAIGVQQNLMGIALQLVVDKNIQGLPSVFSGSENARILEGRSLASADGQIPPPEEKVRSSTRTGSLVKLTINDGVVISKVFLY